MLIDLDRCTRCDECVQACVNTHDDGRSRLFLDGPRFGQFLVPLTCRSCLDPVCMIGCPVGSIHRGDNRQIVIEDWCIGCDLCADNVPTARSRCTTSASCRRARWAGVFGRPRAMATPGRRWATATPAGRPARRRSPSAATSRKRRRASAAGRRPAGASGSASRSRTTAAARRARALTTSSSSRRTPPPASGSTARRWRPRGRRTRSSSGTFPIPEGARLVAAGAERGRGRGGGPGADRQVQGFFRSPYRLGSQAGRAGGGGGAVRRKGRDAPRGGVRPVQFAAGTGAGVRQRLPP